MAKTVRNWRRLQPTSLRDALEMCKEHAREKLNRSVDHIAEAMGITDKWVVYRMISTGRIPANMIRPYESACGIDFVTRWIAASAGKLLVDIPSGRKLKSADVVALHDGFAAAVQLLAALYEGKGQPDETAAALTSHLTQVAWHRQNVMQHAEPELDFGQ